MRWIIGIACIIAIATQDLSVHGCNLRYLKWRYPRPTCFIFHLLKKKLHYPQVEKIPTVAPNANCICVPYYQCDANNTIITDGTGAIDPRLKTVTYRRCTGDFEVCCQLPASSMAPIVNPTAPTMPPTAPPTQPPTQPPTEPPTQPPTEPPTQPPTEPPTQPPTEPPTQPPTEPPTEPPTQPPTEPPTEPPTQPPTQPPTEPPTLPPTEPPTQPPTEPPTLPPTDPPTIPPTLPPTLPPTVPPPRDCICVPANQCDSNGYIITSGEGIINPRQTANSCPIPDYVCCKLRETSVTFPTAQTLVTLPTFVTAIPTGQPISCICVMIYQCDSNGYIINSGTGSIDPRLQVGRQGQVAGTCVSPSEICCKIGSGSQTGLPVEFPTNPNTIPMGSIKNPGTPNACACVKSWQCTQGNVVYLDGVGVIDPRFTACPCADEVCCRLQGITRNLVSSPMIGSGVTNGLIITTPTLPDSSATCGIRRTTCLSDQTCATNPGEASFTEFPWMVALLIRKPDGTSLFLCGASMINTRAILTAAHCLVNRESGALIARFGEWNTANTNEPAPFQEAVIQSVITHPQYYNGGLFNDVAVLILATPVTYAINVMPICLPQQGMVFPAGLRCWATGWGRNAFEGQYQTIMRMVDLPIIDRNDCQMRLRTTRLGQYFQLHGSFICAGGESSKDTCRGDGGGPLVCPTSSGRYVQVGIVAWGIGCGESNIPAVYAGVSLFRLWIDQQLANHGVL